MYFGDFQLFRSTARGGNSHLSYAVWSAHSSLLSSQILLFHCPVPSALGDVLSQPPPDLAGFSRKKKALGFLLRCVRACVCERERGGGGRTWHRSVKEPSQGPLARGKLSSALEPELLLSFSHRAWL